MQSTGFIDMFSGAGLFSAGAVQAGMTPFSPSTSRSRPSPPTTGTSHPWVLWAQSSKTGQFPEHQSCWPGPLAKGSARSAAKIPSTRETSSPSPSPYGPSIAAQTSSSSKTYPPSCARRSGRSSQEGWRLSATPSKPGSSTRSTTARRSYAADPSPSRRASAPFRIRPLTQSAERLARYSPTLCRPTIRCPSGPFLKE